MTTFRPPPSLRAKYDILIWLGIDHFVLRLAYPPHTHTYTALSPQIIQNKQNKTHFAADLPHTAPHQGGGGVGFARSHVVSGYRHSRRQPCR